MLTMNELTAPAAPIRTVRGREVRLLSARDEPEDPQPTDQAGHVVPDITPFVAADAKGDLVTSQGATMPRGVYDRSTSKKRKGKAEAAAPAGAEQALEKKPRQARAPRTAPAANAGKPRRPQEPGERFAVWSDGSVEIDAPGCKGRLSAESVASLYDYVTRLRGGA
jgi:hypothetical protein